MSDFDFGTSALVIIDLQKGIVRARNGQDVVDKTCCLIDAFRKNNALIAFVHVDFIDDRDRISPLTDTPAQAVKYPTDWAEFVPDMAVDAGDYVVTKRSWGAFMGTDLDIELRRRGIKTIVLCGIATNMGVESTAREAFTLGYNQIFITDAMKASTQEEHDASCRYVFPKLGRLRTTTQFLDMLNRSTNKSID